MNDQTANPGRIQFIAGGIDPLDINGNTVNILKSLIRETNEEIGIDLNDQNLVLNIEPRFLVHWGSLALIYGIQLDMDSSKFGSHYQQFETGLKEKGIEPEFSSLVLLKADAQSISEFLEWDHRPKVDFLSAVLITELTF